ncbi:hypothetical protein BGZ54_004712 [Gamsiella multidivaricata]|nr:hypothetical protein BGZ54_004712 [Gamsiella multidivaricata]
MIGINHRDTTNDSKAPIQESTMAPPSSDTVQDPLQKAQPMQEQEHRQGQNSNSDSNDNSPKTNSIKTMDTPVDEINIDAPSKDSGIATEVTEAIEVTASVPRETSRLDSRLSPTYAVSEDKARDGNNKGHQDIQSESAQLDASIASVDQRTGQPLLSQHQGMIIVTKPKLKRPPLRPIDLDSVPKKSILKKESAYPFIEQPVRNPIFKSQWLQSTVSKLVVMSGPATPTAYTANSPSMFQKLVTQATAATMATPPSSTASAGPNGVRTRRPGGPPIFANNERPHSLLDSNGSSISLLSDKSLKRVRFSVGQLTTEHVFHHDDAYESADESEPQKNQVQIVMTPAPPKKLLTTSDGVIVDDNIYTAKEIMNYYLVACDNREEFPIDRLVDEMKVASSRPSNPLLTTIDLSSEQLPRKVLEPIADVLTLEFGLKHLSLDNCGLEDDTLKMMLYSILLTDTLTVLSLQDNKKIKTTGFKYISVFVKKTKALKSLNVSGIAMDKRSVEFLAHALRIGRLGFGSRLEELRMDRCGLRGNLLEIMAPAIRESNLKSVSMRSNRIGASGGVWIGVLLRDYEDHPNAVIPINNEEQGFRRVFPGISNPELLKRMHGIEVLDISDNDLRQGADYVAQMLRRNMSLKSLVMANNNLDPARLAVLADALKLNIGLESLDLSYNRVCGPIVKGLTSLIQKLTFNKTLTKLTLSNTGLQSEGAIALAEFLPETRTLTQLDLTGNDLVDIAGAMALSVSIRMNKSLTCLDMNVPPNDAEFARLSRDILRACIRNMEEKTGSNAGMPSPDDMPTNTIFRQPSSVHIPEPTATTAEDRRWLLLEGVAGELYRTRETLNAMEKAMNHEKAVRRNWSEHFYLLLVETNEQAAPSPVANGQVGEPQESSTVTPAAPVPVHPEREKMIAFSKGILYRASPQVEQLYHQCKRHQVNIMNFTARTDNDKALHELDSMFNLLNFFLEAYRGLFALPEIPANFVVNKRTNSLPPADSNIQPVPVSDSLEKPSEQLVNGDKQEKGQDQNRSQNQNQGQDQGQDQSQDQDQEQVVPEVFTEEPSDDLESSFLLEDEDDMDDEVYTNDALIDVRRTSLLGEHRSTTPPIADEHSTGNVGGYHGKELRPTPVTTSGTDRTDGERSPSTLASPLEKLRKAAEEEEGEVLRRGKDLLENELGNDLVDETMTGEELKIQILASETDL